MEESDEDAQLSANKKPKLVDPKANATHQRTGTGNFGGHQNN